MISFDGSNQSSLITLSYLIDIGAIFFHKKLDQIQISIIGSPMERSSLGINSKWLFDKSRFFGKNILNILDVIPLNIVEQILIIGISIKNTFDSAHFKLL
jgi:hypothetical protein